MPQARKTTRKKHPRPVIVWRNRVRRRTGGRLSRPLLWQGRQWAVTGYGVEARDGTYPIPKKRLAESNEGHGWEEHMAEKNWVIMSDFLAALTWARNHFGIAPEGAPASRGAAPTKGTSRTTKSPTIEELLA